MTVADRYIADRPWQSATLSACPLHPGGACGLRRLGTYARVIPVGVRIARFWCPLARVSISLLPAFLAARMRGALDNIEEAVLAAEQAESFAAAVELVHPADAEHPIGAVCARRSLRRRVRAVRAALLALVTLLPERLGGVGVTVAALRQALGTVHLLVELRIIAERYLGALPTPLGLRPRASA